jgi:hypothetical protein
MKVVQRPRSDKGSYCENDNAINVGSEGRCKYGESRCGFHESSNFGEEGPCT